MPIEVVVVVRIPVEISNENRILFHMLQNERVDGLEWAASPRVSESYDPVRQLAACSLI